MKTISTKRPMVDSKRSDIALAVVLSVLNLVLLLFYHKL